MESLKERAHLGGLGIDGEDNINELVRNRMKGPGLD